VKKAVTPAEAVTVLIADDHPIFRKGLHEVLTEDSAIQLVGEAADGATALQKIRELKPQIAVLDMDMPQLSGLEIARKVSQLKLQVKLVILTLYKEERLFNEAIEAGVLGYVLKENAATDLLSCVHAVAAGQPFISPSLSSLLLNRNARAKELIAEKPALESLTATERRILKLVAQDLTSKEIGEKLAISFHTVENHRANISEKLGLRGSHSLLKFAFANKDRL
jgi:DNA-binding NarL/FixJ family response regulator